MWTVGLAFASRHLEVFKAFWIGTKPMQKSAHSFRSFKNMSQIVKGNLGLSWEPSWQKLWRRGVAAWSCQGSWPGQGLFVDDHYIAVSIDLGSFKSGSVLL